MPDLFADGMWVNEEKSYLESASEEAKKEFAAMSASEKKDVLRNHMKATAASTPEAQETMKWILDRLRD